MEGRSVTIRRLSAGDALLFRLSYSREIGPQGWIEPPSAKAGRLQRLGSPMPSLAGLKSAGAGCCRAAPRILTV